MEPQQSLRNRRICSFGTENKEHEQKQHKGSEKSVDMIRYVDINSSN